MFRNVYFMGTMSAAQHAELKDLNSTVRHFMRCRMHLNGQRYTEAKAESVKAKARIVELKAELMFTSDSHLVELRTVKGDVCYDIVELPPFLRRECMLPMLIAFIISTVDDRHNGGADFKIDYDPWAFHDIHLKGVNSI